MVDEREHAIMGTTWETYHDEFMTTVLLEDCCVDAGCAATENESLAQASLNYVIDNLVSLEEFEVEWRKRHPVVGNQARLFGTKGIKVRNTQPNTVLSGNTKVKPRAAAIPPPDDLTDETWLAPVQASKYLGIPPQYLYNRIKQGRLTTKGERPKLIRWGDVKR